MNELIDNITYLSLSSPSVNCLALALDLGVTRYLPEGCEDPRYCEQSIP